MLPSEIVPFMVETKPDEDREFLYYMKDYNTRAFIYTEGGEYDHISDVQLFLDRAYEEHVIEVLLPPVHHRLYPINPNSVEEYQEFYNEEPSEPCEPEEYREITPPLENTEYFNHYMKLAEETDLTVETIPYMVRQGTELVVNPDLQKTVDGEK